MLLRETSADQVLSRVKALPDELSKLYEKQLHEIDDSNVEIALRIFTWVCLTIDILSVGDLRYAVCMRSATELGSIEELESDAEHWTDSNEHFKRRARDISGGLLPIMKVTCEDSPTRDAGTFKAVVPDHESVTEFMCQSGLTSLHKRSHSGGTQPSLGQLHLDITRNLFRLMSSREVGQRIEKWEDGDGPDLVRGLPHVGSLRPPEVPLLHYAGISWTRHLKSADKEGAEPKDIVSLLQLIDRNSLTNWKRVNCVEAAADMGYYHSEFYEKFQNFFQVVCRLGLQRTLDVLIPPSGDQTEFSRNINLQDLMESENPRGITPLMQAAALGDCSILERLLENGAQPKHVNKHGDSAFRMAAERGNVGAMEILHRFCLDVDRRHEIQASALFVAAEKGQVEAVKWMVENDTVGAHSHQSMSPVMERIFSDMNNGNPDFEKERSMFDRNMHPSLLLNTPLTAACKRKSPELVNVLLMSKHILPGLSDCLGDTILHREYGGKFTSLLVESGKFDLTLNAANRNGETPLSHAASAGNADTVAALLNTNSITVEHLDSSGRTPLMLAIQSPNRSRTIVKLLLETNEVDVWRQSPTLGTSAIMMVRAIKQQTDEHGQICDLVEPYQICDMVEAYGCEHPQQCSEA